MNKKQKNISGYKLEQVPVVLTPNEVSLILQIEEKEVIKLLSEGKTQKNIASELYISIDTVRYQCKNIYSKLGVNSNLEAVKIYLNG